MDSENISSPQYLVLRTIIQHLVQPPSDEMEEFLGLFRPRNLPQGWYFLHAGDASTELAFIGSGLLRLFYQSEDGKEFNKGFNTENQFSAAYSAAVGHTPARFSIQALEEASLLVAPIHSVLELFDEHRCWDRLGRILAEQLLIKQEVREAEFLLDDAATRYQRFIEEYPDLNHRLTQYHIARYLGISPDELSEIYQHSSVLPKLCAAQ
jgi:CRP-like cAMP-binding protein